MNDPFSIADGDGIPMKDRSTHHHSHSQGQGHGHEHGHGGHGGHGHGHGHSHEHHHENPEEGVGDGVASLYGATNAGEHCHGETSATSIDRAARRKLIIASILCLLFMSGEIVGGAIAGSLAIMTDAAHLLTDFASFMISLLAIYLASLPATKKMSFGWHRAEIVGALVSVLLIWVVTGILVYMAVLRVLNPDYHINAKAMLITAGVGVGVNIIMAATLHQHSHSHAGSSSHSHNVNIPPSTESTPIASPTHTAKAGDGGAGGDHGSSHSHQDKENINVRAAFIHVIGDFIQSLGVFIAALVIYVKPQYKIADPICTFVFSVLVLVTTITILRDTMHVLMEGTPKGLDFNEVKQALYEVPGVIEVHNLRIWSLTTTKTAVSAHLAYDIGYDANSILKQASRRLRNNFQIHDVTIQMEQYVPQMSLCETCQGPSD